MTTIEQEKDKTLPEIREILKKQFDNQIISHMGADRRGGWSDHLEYQIIVAEDLESFQVKILKGEVHGWKELWEMIEELTDVYYEEFANFIGEDIWSLWTMRDNTFIFETLFYDPGYKGKDFKKAPPQIAHNPYFKS